MNIADIIQREAVSVGRPVNLIYGKHLPGGVVAVTYSTTSEPAAWKDGKRATTVRVACWKEDGTPLFSAIVSTVWS